MGELDFARIAEWSREIRARTLRNLEREQGTTQHASWTGGTDAHSPRARQICQ